MAGPDPAEVDRAAPETMWAKYQMKQGDERIGPCLGDLKWNGVSLVIAAAFCAFAFPVERAHTFRADWVLLVFARNFITMCAFFHGFHYFLYQHRPTMAALKDNKFNPKFPPETQHTRDRRYTLLSLAINTAMECGVLHLYATGRIPMYGSFFAYPLWSLAFLLLSPFWRELHFFVYHYLLHIQPVYKWFHAHHHLSYNTSPWSGLSMHPVESIAYFTGPIMFVACGLTLHPLHFVFGNVHAQLASVYGHHGYDVYGGSYFHYLHHAKVRYNYGTPFVPLDILCGTWHAGKAKAA